MNKFLPGLLVASALCFGSAAHAADADFLKSLEGNWAGKGSVKVDADSSADQRQLQIRVGHHRQFDVARRQLHRPGGDLSRHRREIKTDGKSYKGTYIGSSTGPAGLSGKRSGNALNLGIRWAKDVNGDRSAKLRLEKVGDNGMRLTTIDTDPATGKSVVISDINLRRL